MGEYVKIRGQQVKIGTCESLFYTTLEQFKNALPYIKKDENSCNPDYYLKPDVFRFRFPFPDEKGIEIGCHKDFNRGFLLVVPSFLDMHHDKIFIRTDTLKIGAPAIGFHVPCVVSEKFDFPIFDWSKIKSQRAIEIVAQKICRLVSGGVEVRTIVRCPYCGALSQLDSKEAANLFEWSLSQGSKEVVEICRIIFDGYKYEVDQDKEVNMHSNT